MSRHNRDRRQQEQQAQGPKVLNQIGIVEMFNGREIRVKLNGHVDNLDDAKRLLLAALEEVERRLANRVIASGLMLPHEEKKLAAALAD